jgi:hypothetical protein
VTGISDQQAENKRLRNNHKDVVRTKRRTDARLKIALAALQQIYEVCKDNAPESCDARMALNFVQEVAADGFNRATALPFHSHDPGGVISEPPAIAKSADAQRGSTSSISLQEQRGAE